MQQFRFRGEKGSMFQNVSPAGRPNFPPSLEGPVRSYGALSANALATADLAPRLRLKGLSEATARYVGGFAKLPAFA